MHEPKANVTAEEFQQQQSAIGRKHGESDMVHIGHHDANESFDALTLIDGSQYD